MGLPYPGFWDGDEDGLLDPCQGTYHMGAWDTLSSSWDACTDKVPSSISFLLQGALSFSDQRGPVTLREPHIQDEGH